MSSSNCVCYSLFPSDYLPYCYSFVDCLVRASLAPLHVESALSAKPDWWKHTECRSPQNSHESSQRPDSPYKIHHKHNSSIGRRPYSYHKKHTTAWLQLLWHHTQYMYEFWLFHMKIMVNCDAAFFEAYIQYCIFLLYENSTFLSFKDISCFTGLLTLTTYPEVASAESLQTPWTDSGKSDLLK